MSTSRLLVRLAAVSVLAAITCWPTTMRSQSPTALSWSFAPLATIIEPDCAPTVVLGDLTYSPEGGRLVAWTQTPCGPRTNQNTEVRYILGAGVEKVRNPACTNLGCIGLIGAPVAVDYSGGVPNIAYAAPVAETYYAFVRNLDVAPETPMVAKELIGHYQDCRTTSGFALHGGTYALGTRCGGAGWLSLNGTLVHGQRPIDPLPVGHGGDFSSVGFVGGGLVYYAARNAPNTGGVFYSSGSPGHETLIAQPHFQRGAEVDGAAGADGLHVAIGGIPFEGNAFEGGLVYAFSSGGSSWSTTFVDTISGRHPSVAIDPGGRPAIAYWRDRELRLARLINGQWITSLVSLSSVDTRSSRLSLAFNQAGEPEILYYDPHTGRLLLARGVRSLALPGVVDVTIQGTGRVLSSPAGIDCGGHCSGQFGVGRLVTLTAHETSASRFVGWLGACSGLAACVVRTDTDPTSVAAVFAAPPSLNTILVTSVDEIDGLQSCTLREALVAADTDLPYEGCPAGSGADLIRLPSGVFTVSNTVGQIRSDITIEGAGQGQTILQAGVFTPEGELVSRSSSLFTFLEVYATGLPLPKTGHLSLRGMTIRGATFGAVTVRDAAAVISDVTFAFNHANSGGAININGGRLRLDRATFDRNTANTFGGAVNVAGAISVTNSAFRANASLDGTGGAFVLSAAGSVGTIAGSIFQSNSAVWAGGAIYNNATLTVSNTAVDGNALSMGNDGSGIKTNSVLTLLDSTITNNTHGAGLGTGGTTLVSGSLIAGNSSPWNGGGVLGGGTLTIVNSTLSGNTAEHNGGGIFFDHGQLATLNNVTITNNRAVRADGGGFFRAFHAQAFRLSNSIIAGNNAASDTHDCWGEFGDVSATSLGYNILGRGANCFVPAIGDIVGTTAEPVDPRLGPLQDNGGTTWTHALLPGSPALDSASPADVGNEAACEATDQRGESRPFNSRCDMGAVEFIPYYTLSIQKEGEGTGSVLSTDGRIDCGDAACAASYRAGSVVWLNAAVASTSSFESWSGCTEIVEDSCRVEVIGDTTVTARFGIANRPPTARDDVATTDEDVSVLVPIMANDGDSDHEFTSLQVSIVAAPLHGTVTPEMFEYDGMLQVAIRYTPAANFHGEDTFSYSISDGEATARAMAVVTVLPINDPPTAVSDDITTDEDQEVTALVLANDLDVDSPASTLVLSIDVSAQNGSATMHSTVIDGGTVQSIRYRPHFNFNGSDTFVYRVSDGQASATGTVNVTVRPVHDDLGARNDEIRVVEDQAVSVAFLANDLGDIVSSRIVGAPRHGTATIELIHGTWYIRYLPMPNQTQPVTIDYEVTDDVGETDVARVSIEIVPVVDVQVVVDDSWTIDEDTPSEMSPLLNDVDVDRGFGGLMANFAIASQPEHGSVAIVDYLMGDELIPAAIRYTPDLNFNGHDSFTYSVANEDGTVVVGTVSVSVFPIRDTPIAVADALTTPEDTILRVPMSQLFANDSDPDSDFASWAIVEHPEHGTLTVERIDGLDWITYRPNPNRSGFDFFRYALGDLELGGAIARVIVRVEPQPDVQIVQNDQLTLDEDTSAIIRVLDNDSDLDSGIYGLAGGFRLSAQPAHGTATIETDLVGDANLPSLVRYTPAANFHGIDTFTYSVSNSLGTVTGTVTVTVRPINDQPTAADDDVTTNEDTAIEIRVLDNDSDPEMLDSQLSLSMDSVPANGTITARFVSGPDGFVPAILYTPRPNFHGTDSFTYSVRDGEFSVPGTVRITVNPVNDPPIAADMTWLATEDHWTERHIAAVRNLASDPDHGDDALTVSIERQPEHGTVVIGVFNGIEDLRYTPHTNFNGTDTFQYRIFDPSGGFDVAEVTVMVQSVPDRPVAERDDATTAEDVPVTIPVLRNDSDADGDTLQLSVAAVPTSQGSVISVETVQSAGSIEQVLRYQPGPNFHGVEVVAYAVSDGEFTTTGTVRIVVEPVNDAPVAADMTWLTTEDNWTERHIAAVLNLASDPDHGDDALTVSIERQPEHGTVVIGVFNGIEDLRYTPHTNFNGTDTFQYRISDPSSGFDIAEVTVLVQSVPDRPVAERDDATTAEDVPVTIPVLRNDSDADGDTLQLSVEDPSTSHGSTITVETVTSGDSVERVLRYQPAPNFHGEESFSYTVSDGVHTASASVRVTVNSVPDDPVTRAHMLLNVIEDQTRVDTERNFLSSRAFDPDGDSVRIESIVRQPAHGRVEVVDHTFEWRVHYTPDPNFNGSDSFEYRVVDESGATAIGLVSVLVISVEDPTTAVDDVIVIDEDAGPVDIPVLDNDFDGDGNILSLLGRAGTSALGHFETLSDAAFTGIRYLSNPNAYGEDTIFYSVHDGSGDWVTGTVRITVRPVNDPPVAVDDHITLHEDGSFASTLGYLTNNDVDPDATDLFASIITQPAHGTVELEFHTGPTVFRYRPNPNFSGQDSFEYRVTDGAGGSDTGTAFVTVTSLNDGPRAENDEIAVNEDGQFSQPVSYFFANDTDPDGDTLTSFTVTVAPQHGVVTVGVDGVTYRPAANYYGVDSFTYRAADPSDFSDLATVSVTVQPVNDPPQASADSVTVTAGIAALLEVLGNDSDVDGDAITLHSLTQPRHGTASITEGSIRLTATAGYGGADAFTYTIRDSNGTESTARVAVTVNNTATGSNVIVHIGTSGSVTFSSVSTAGVTSATPIANTDVAPGVRHIDPPAAYDIETTAATTGSTTVCVNYQEAGDTIEGSYQLHHQDSTGWHDITSRRDTTNNTICGVTASFSPFVVVQPDITPGRMTGNGHIDTTTVRQFFTFNFVETADGSETGAFHYWTGGKSQPIRFRATVVTSLRFSGAQVVASGVGTWDGLTGYSFVVEGFDGGEGSNSTDAIRLTIRNPQGAVIAALEGLIAGGNIQVLPPQ